MAREEPELAARLVLQTLPAAAARIPGPLTYDLSVEGMGTWSVDIPGDGSARVNETRAANGDADFELITDPRGLAEMAGGASPLRLMLRGRV
jgi:hypothetical protein